MTGANPTTPDSSNITEGLKATHITPETGDTARATMRENSSAGTHGSEPSPPEGAHIGSVNRGVQRLDDEGRSFQGGDDGDLSAETARTSEAIRDVTDGDD